MSDFENPENLTDASESGASAAVDGVLDEAEDSRVETSSTSSNSDVDLEQLKRDLQEIEKELAALRDELETAEGDATAEASNGPSESD